MSEEVLQDIIIATSSKEVWDSLQMKFASSTKARTVQIRVKLMTSKKRDISAADFFHKITGLANKLTAADAPLRDEEVLAYLLASLLVEYDPFITSMMTKSEALSLDDVFAHLIAFEARRLQHQVDMQLHFCTSTNYAGRGVSFCGRGDRAHGGRSRGGAPCVVITAMVTPSPSAKSTAKSAIPPSNAGTGWMIHTRKKGCRWPWHLQAHTGWIQIGTMILTPRITSRAISIALPCVSSTTVETLCKLAMEQVCEFYILVLIRLILILTLLHSIVSFMFPKYQTSSFSLQTIS
jgi:hypothetical protein